MRGSPFRARSAAFGDYDNDGWPDLFLSEDLGSRIALWHNEGNGRFTDRTVIVQADIPPREKGGGAVFGDYDNDGDVDLFVPVGMWRSTGRVLNVLLRNDRGVFRDVTLGAGLTDELPTDNAIWFDYDRDGHIDLYVGNVGSGGHPDPTVRNKLYRSNGDGTFSDVTKETGLDIQLHPDSGGSNGGMAAGDFNHDGWPDLYVGVFEASNRLFLNDGQGGFQDATTSEIADSGEAYGMAVGDINNDGHLDIFQAAGGSWEEAYRSLMLLNLGAGQFLDVTPGVGLSGLLARNTVSGGLADIDNDGDLDLITGDPYFLHLNNGDGTFADRTSDSGITQVGASLSFGDFDLDGFLDLWLGRRLYRNNGNDNHYLRIELVGMYSNRTGIGARLIATSGGLQQTREILGGLGYYQDELVAHFGLGQRTQVDRLEIRWPSGVVDVLEHIPANQKIRVFEGREGYHVVTPTVWEDPLPDTLVVGSTVGLNATVRPAFLAPKAEVLRLRADLSGLGGSSEVVLTDVGKDSYRLESTFTVGGPNGLRDIVVDQETSWGSYWTRVKTVAVLPAEDLVLYEEGVGAGWSVEVVSGNVESDLTSSTFVHSGSFSHAVSLKPGAVRYLFDDAGGVDPLGYTHLQFYINGGAASGQKPTIAGRKMSDVGVEVQADTWTLGSIPISEVPLDQRGCLTGILITGFVKETFYLDDMKLVAHKMEEPVQAVEASEGRGLPSGYALCQNVPNPFNPITTIAYDLPEASNVTLTLYTLTGQKVATLMSGHQEAGHYEVRWDGSGFGNGIYFYRLEAGEFVETRRMVLIK